MNINLVTDTKTSKKEKFYYALFFLGQNFFYMLVYLYLSIYFTDYVLIPPSIVASIFLGARIWDAINDPIMGLIVDKVSWKKGKFTPWMRLSSFILPIISVLMFSISSNMNMGLKITFATLTYVSFGMAYTLNDAPAFSLSTAMSDNVNERSVLLSYGRIAAAIATILIAVLTPLLIATIGWFYIALIVSFIGLITMVPATYFCKERCSKKEASPTFKEIFMNIKENKYLLIFLLCFLVASSFNFVETISSFVAKYNFGDLEMASILSAIALAPMLIVPLILPILLKKFDKKYILIASAIINIIFSIANYFTGTSIIPFSIIMFFRCVGLGGFTTLSYMFVADCIEYGAFKTGKKAEGVSFSLQTLATKMSGALGGAIPLYIFSAFGLDANKTVSEQSTSAIQSIWVSFTLLPIIGMIFLVPVMLFGYKLKDKDIQMMVKINQKEEIDQEIISTLKKKYGIEEQHE